MPYIKPKQREPIDKAIDDGLLIHALRFVPLDNRAGAVNYAISRIVVGAMKPKEGWTYPSLSAARAVFRDAEDELRRRLMDPYESHKCVVNGDIPEYVEG